MKNLQPKHYIGIGIFILVILIIIFPGSSDKNQEDLQKGQVLPSSQQEDSQEGIQEQSETEPLIGEESVREDSPELELEPKSTSETKTNRDKMIEIFKTDALAKWGDDYSMVKYEIEKQTEAYDWVIKNTEYPDILERAEQKWGNDYSMVKYEYEKQAEAYEWINQQTVYPEIMARAKQKWGDDYAMVKYEYEKQVEAYESL